MELCNTLAIRTSDLIMKYMKVAAQLMNAYSVPPTPSEAVGKRENDVEKCNASSQ